MKKLKLFTILSLMSVILLFVIPFSTSAAGIDGKLETELQVIPHSHYIELSLELDGNKVVITDINQDNKVVYEGNEENVKLNDLEADSMYRYNVTVVDQSGINIENYYFSTKTKTNFAQSRDSQSSTEELNLHVDAVVSKEQVTLTWDAVPNVTKYKILKNNKLIGEVTEPIFKDMGTLTENYIPYEIQFDVPLSATGREEVREYYKNAGKTLSSEELNNISYKPYSIVKVVEPSLVMAAAINNSFKWTYKTFIPMNYAEDPWYNAATWGKDIKYFKGDNRGFSSTAETYRTKTVGDSIFYTDSTTASEAFYKDVHTTYAYDENYSLVSSKTDSGNNINRLVNSISASKVDVTVYHKSGNPYAVSGNEIDYNLRVITQKGGSYSFEGIHDRAPSHELYLRLSNGNTVEVYKNAHEGFEYLGAPSTLAKTFFVSN